MNIEGLVHAWHHASARKTDPVEVAKLPFLLEALKTADADAFAEWLASGDDLETCFLGLQGHNPTGMTALLLDAGVTVFRLVCSTSWQGDTTLTVTGTPNGDIPLVAATCEQTPSHFDHEDDRQRVLVDPAAYVSFERAFQAADFWSMPESLAFGNDGSIWAFEVFDAGRYRRMAQWEPHDGPFYELCSSYLRLFPDINLRG